MANSIVRNSAKLLSANVFAQALGLAVYPILTRLYAPEDFGVMNLFYSIAGILVLFATAEYHSAIVLPQKDEEAILLMRGMLITTAVVVVFTLLSTCLSTSIAQLFGSPNLANWYWLMPLCVITLAGWNIMNYWHIRKQQYNPISRYQYTLSATSAAAKIGCGWAGWLQGGLIVSTIFGQLVALMADLWRNRQDLLSIFKKTPHHRAEIQQTALRYRKFPQYNLPRTIVNYISGQLPVLLFAPMFGERYVGFWGMAILLGFSPITMISKALYQVLYGHIAESKKQNQSIIPFIRKFTGYIITIEIPAIILLYWAMPWLVRLILGEEWLPTSDILRWMLPWIGAIILTSSTGFFSDLFEQQKIGFVFEIVSALVRLSSIGIGLLCWNSFVVATACYSIGNFLTVTAMYIWHISMAYRYEKSVGTD